MQFGPPQVCVEGRFVALQNSRQRGEALVIHGAVAGGRNRVIKCG